MTHFIISITLVIGTMILKIPLNQYDKLWNQANQKKVRSIKKEFSHVPNLKVHFEGYTKIWNTLTITWWVGIVYLLITTLAYIFK